MGNRGGVLKIRFHNNNGLVLIHETITSNYDFTLDLGEECYCYIGNNVYLDRGSANVTYKHGTLIIDDDTTAGGITAYANHEDNLEIIIGKRCMISYNLLIRASDAHAIYSLSDPETCINKACFGVHVDDDVWI